MIKRVLFVLALFVAFASQGQQKQKSIAYFSYDNGATWENKSSGLPEDIFISDVTTGPDGTLVLSTKRNGLFSFNNQSNQWQYLGIIPFQDDINILWYHKRELLAGTGANGVFASHDLGKSWRAMNGGLTNLVIRKLSVIGDILFAGTNGGLYSYNEATKRWTLTYGKDLQVNGITSLNGDLFIGTNKGVFKKEKNSSEWRSVLPKRSVHNISCVSGKLYAMLYNELFVSVDKGKTWRSDQSAMPDGMYTFQVVENNGSVFSGQWDGVYRKEPFVGWRLLPGLPTKFPAIELISHDGVLVAVSSQWVTAEIAK